MKEWGGAQGLRYLQRRKSADSASISYCKQQRKTLSHNNRPMLDEESRSGFPRRLPNSLYNWIFDPQLLQISKGPLPFKFRI
jgi:hypothetical protein